MPKTGDTRRHCEVELTVCNNPPQPPPYISFFGGCRRLLHTVNSTLQCLLVSPVFGMVSSLYPTSFLMTCYSSNTFISPKEDNLSIMDKFIHSNVFVM